MYIPYPSPYPTEKVGDFPYPYPYSVNAGIPRQNGDGFGQYPRGRVYLPCLHTSDIKKYNFIQLILYYALNDVKKMGCSLKEILNVR